MNYFNNIRQILILHAILFIIQSILGVWNKQLFYFNCNKNTTKKYCSSFQ